MAWHGPPVGRLILIENCSTVPHPLHLVAIASFSYTANIVGNYTFAICFEGSKLKRLDRQMVALVNGYVITT